MYTPHKKILWEVETNILMIRFEEAEIFQECKNKVNITLIQFLQLKQVFTTIIFALIKKPQMTVQEEN